MLKCLNPLIAKRIKNNQQASKHKQQWIIPCGKCVNCLKAKSYNTYRKLSGELKNNLDPAYFITLTYRNSKVKYLDKKDIQLFLKRLRKHWHGKTLHRTIKYYIIGEYGELTHRPHYHGIIWLNKPLDLRQISSKGYYSIELTDAWEHGIVHVMPIADGMVKYIASHKVNNQKLQQIKYKCGELCIVNKSFVLQSKQICKSYIDKELTKYIDSGMCDNNQTVNYFIKKYRLGYIPSQSQKNRIILAKKIKQYKESKLLSDHIKSLHVANSIANKQAQLKLLDKLVTKIRAKKYKEIL